MSTNTFYKILGCFVGLILLFAIIGSCNNRHHYAPGVAYDNYGAPVAGYGQPAPVVVNGNSGPGFGTGAILGGIGGYLAGKSASNNAPVATTATPASATQPAATATPAAPATSKFNRSATTIDNKVMPTLNKPAAPVAAPAPVAKPTSSFSLSKSAPASAPRPSFSAPKTSSFKSSGGGSFSRRR